MLIENKYPDFIWDEESGHLVVEKTGSYFIESSEYCDIGPRKFSTLNEVHQYLIENKIAGSVGRKIK